MTWEEKQEMKALMKSGKTGNKKTNVKLEASSGPCNDVRMRGSFIWASYDCVTFMQSATCP